jgi:hypothetical protein
MSGRKNLAQTFFFSKLINKETQKCGLHTSAIKKTSTESRPIGENSANLVTLQFQPPTFCLIYLSDLDAVSQFQNGIGKNPLLVKNFRPEDFQEQKNGPITCLARPQKF